MCWLTDQNGCSAVTIGRAPRKLWPRPRRCRQGPRSQDVLRLGIRRGHGCPRHGAARRSPPSEERTAMSATAMRSVGAELDEVAGGVTDVDAAPGAARTEQVGRAHDDLEAAGRCELVEVDAVDDEGDVVDVLTGPVAGEHVDER